MNNILGFVRVKVKKGIDLAIRDTRTSDPYVVVTMGEEQKAKTKVVSSNCNPVWNDDLSLLLKSVHDPVKLIVYDKDTFSMDDEMGDADIDIKPYLRCLQRAEYLQRQRQPSPSTVGTVPPTAENCLAEESCIVYNRGKITQDMRLRLRNVECGEVEIQLDWTDVPGNKGLPQEIDLD